MPVYDFKCLECQHIEEEVFFANWRRAEKPQHCPECGAEMERLYPSQRYGMVMFRHGGKVNFWYTKSSDPDSQQVGHNY